jgi:hypothetical protein
LILRKEDGPEFINIMKKKLLIYSFLIFFSLFFCQAGNAAPIDETLARTVAENFLSHLGQSASAHQISDIKTMELAGERIGFLIELSPQGYILVASDSIRVPVKAYSLQTIFASLPPAYVENLLAELSIPASTVALRSATVPENTNSTFWDFLTANTPMALSTMYIPDTHLLTTFWNQTYPYNAFNPLVDEQVTLTGCTQTAIAQVMRYHKHPASGNGVFTHSWNDQTLTAIMNRPFNWEILSESPHNNTKSWEHEEVASLMLDLGILNEADFGVDGTSSYFHIDSFRQAFGYAPIYSMNNGDPTFFETLRNEVDNLRPVLLVIPGHLTVADGYSSDPTGKNIHINMGWGGAYDDYYYLDDTIVAGGYSFPPNNTIYYNIKPCIGDECLAPYPPAGNNKPPEFLRPLNNIAINDNYQVRLDSRDPDGDPVTLSAFSTCSAGQLPLNGNLLIFNQPFEDQLCKFTIFSTSHDGTAVETFNVLTGPADTYRGEQFDIDGQFADGAEVDEYHVFLSGSTTISGNRGYSTQAFFIWVKDQSGTTVTTASNEPITAVFTPGYYTIAASLTSPSGSYYLYDPDFSEYYLSISVESSIDEIGAFSGLSLPECQLAIDKSGDGGGTVTSLPGGIDCGPNCSETLVCNSEIQLSTTADAESVFTNWSGDCAGTSPMIFYRLQDNSTCVATFTKDIDQDGMPDSWELQYGLDTTINDAHEDKDNDGIDNLTEYRNGTPPIVLPGDINGDDIISIKDVLLALKVVSGEFSGGIKIESDVDGDNLIGLAEALYGLKEASLE